MVPVQRKCTKGSLTVEATFLMPLVIGIVVFLIYMGFYFYNIGACIYTAYMATALATNAQETIEDSTSLSNRTIALDQPSVVVTEERNCLVSEVSGTQRIPFVNKKLSIKGSDKQVRLDQRDFILQCRFFEKALE